MPPILKSVAWLIFGPALSLLLAWLILSGGAGGPDEGESGVSAGSLLFAGVVFVVGVFTSLIYASAALRPTLEEAGRPHDLARSPFADPSDRMASMDFHEPDRAPHPEEFVGAESSPKGDEQPQAAKPEGDAPESPEGFTCVGWFTLPSARKWFPRLEDHGIEFVFEVDDSAIKDSHGWAASLSGGIGSTSVSTSDGGTSGEGVIIYLHVLDEHLPHYAKLDDEWHDATGARH